jgi:outer membrane protein OmpA-like peptidoglycan-associated protein
MLDEPPVHSRFSFDLPSSRRSHQASMACIHRRTMMPTRRVAAIAALALLAFPSLAAAQAATPSATTIERQLNAAPRAKIRPEQKVTVREFKRRPDLRRMAPSIDIQSINFAFGSAEIPFSQYRKVENIADALSQLLDRRPNSKVLIEGHTDAVGSGGSNLILSERRAASLRRVLVREFGIPGYALDTVGYGEDFLLVQTQQENWRNRRVTLVRYDDFLRN